MSSGWSRPMAASSPNLMPRINPMFTYLVDSHASSVFHPQVLEQDSFIGCFHSLWCYFYILSLPPPYIKCLDKLMRCPAAYGKFTVKSCYNYLLTRRNRSPSFDWRPWWKMKLPQRLLLFGWKIGRNCLPTKDNLIRRHYSGWWWMPSFL